MKMRERIILSCLRAVIRLVCVMPLPWAVALGRSFGLLASLFLSLHLKIGAVQARAALGIDDAGRFMRKVFMNQGELYVLAIRTAHMTDSELMAYVDVQGRDNLEQALASGRSLMIISGHMNWEVLGNAPRVIGREISVMADYIKSRVVQTIADDIRARYRVDVLPPKGGMVKACIGKLRAGRILGMVIDQRGRREDRLFCDVLGLPAPTNPSPAFIALKAEALILPLCGYKENGRFVFRFSKPIDARDFGNDYQKIDGLSESWKSNAVRELSNAMQAWISSIVRERPDQWFWLHCRWARRSDMKRIVRQGIDFRDFVLSYAREDLSRGKALST